MSPAMQRLPGRCRNPAFAANVQAKVCAAAVAALLRDETPSPPKLINTCYSLVAPDYGISIAGVYHPVNGQFADVEGAGGFSPADAPPDLRTLEARYAEAWYRTITAQTFGSRAVTDIHVFNQKNPQPCVAAFHNSKAA